MLEVGAPGAKALQNPLLGLGTAIKPVKKKKKIMWTLFNSGFSSEDCFK